MAGDSDGGRVGSPEVHCQECGQSWGDDATFCGSCGSRLPSRRVGRAARDERARRLDGRGRWLAVAVLGALVVVGAASAAVSDRSPTDEVAADDAEMVVPDGEELQDPETSQVARPEVTCDRAGQPVDCVTWMRHLGSDSDVREPDLGWVDATADRVLAETGSRIVALSRSTGQVAWETDPARGILSGAPGAVVDGVLAMGMGGAVRALSLADGTEQWSVEDARFGRPGWGMPWGPSSTTLVYTLHDPEGQPVVVARDAAGVVRWQYAPTWADPAERRFPPEFTERGDLTFLVREGADHHLEVIALGTQDGQERWRRADSRPLQVVEDVAAMVDVDRDVEEDGGGVSISESPAAVVGLDARDGTELWRQEIPEDPFSFRVVGDVLVVRADGGLTATDLTTGEQRWHEELAVDEGLVTGAPTAATDEARRVVSFDEDDRRLVARDPATGRVRWETSLDQRVRNVSWVEGALLAWQDETTVTHLDPASGEVVGTITIDGRARPVAADVFVDHESRWVFGIDPSHDGS